jgi:predicted nucleic acid-binding Zn ribbon protein
LASLVLTGISARANAITAVKALRSAGLCPSCGYEIGTVVPVEDGCTICPECGAAWRRATVAAGGASGERKI